MNKTKETSYELLTLFFLVLKIATITIGGGLLIISELRKVIVNKRKLISEKDFNEILATSNVIPGVTAINFAFLVGKKLKGFKGAIILTIAGILPSIFVITIIALYINLNPNNIYFQKFLEGAKISSIMIMSMIVFEFSKKMLNKSMRKWITCLLITYALYKFHIDLSHILLTFLLICLVTYTVKKIFMQKKVQI
ncbi:Chromate transport protein [Borrelia nietonii YOR]|uniref:Chromate transport protein n=1 Tax=Borrelia nietonii YOR TaxID=1293576 RepID=A0ABN4C2Y9_9SPIR|nr:MULTISPECIES: chromate transporter [Borrelia]AHH03444.1 Chromate transport protein [Borrelia nietonii YOR]AHH13954.1 Chromate transport protein [Borrelia hermsii MTW]UPA09157.1 chromate transporter [Borrelia nietonii YOR]